MNPLHLERQIVLKRKEDRRVVSGHPWVFSNEIRETKGNPAMGDVVELLSAAGVSLGIGFYNPHSLISFRLLSPQCEDIDSHFFTRRISTALALRATCYPREQAFRLVHGEGDFLPGLVIDRFNEYLVIQTFSFGMDSRLSLICDVLESLLHPAGIIERNESPLRLLENLPQKKGVLRGTAEATTILEHDVRYTVHPLEGQKTGFFLDQRENRLALRRFCKDAKVLDCFCNDGGFSLNAVRGGAASVVGIDSSEEAIRRARNNAALNGFSTVRFMQGDVFQILTELHATHASFDVIVLDPPSFTKSRKNVQTAKKGYKELHLNAFNVLTAGGIVLTSSCSHHIESDVFLDIVHDSAREAGRSLQLLDWRGASLDHPTLPGVPETRYLKLGIFRVS